MFQRILICTDLSDGIERLVQFVPQLAQTGAEKLVFLHSVPMEDDCEIPHEDREAVHAAKQALAPALEASVQQAAKDQGTEVIVEVDSGSPGGAILAALKKHNIDLVLFGSPIRSLLTQKLFGSTAAGLSSKIQCPMMTLRPPVVSTYMEAELAIRCQNLFSQLLVPYDGSKSANYTLAQIKKQVTDNPKSTLKGCTLVWVIDTGSRFQKDEADVKAQLAQAQAELEAVGLTVEIRLKKGTPMEQIMRTATVEDISAIALSDSKPNRLLEWSVSSFGTEVLRQSWHPVLFFPPA